MALVAEGGAGVNTKALPLKSYMDHTVSSVLVQGLAEVNLSLESRSISVSSKNQTLSLRVGCKSTSGKSVQVVSCVYVEKQPC